MTKIIGIIMSIILIIGCSSIKVIDKCGHCGSELTNSNYCAVCSDPKFGS